MYLNNDEVASEVPIIYWVTDPNPARVQQVAAFHDWMKKNGYPAVELRLDTSNQDVSKKLIQGVSGVGSDIIDLGSPNIDFFRRTGLLLDITEYAKSMGFTTDTTFRALESDLTHDGRQYSYPCNISLGGLVINREAFRRLGMETPPERWDFNTFEEIGKEYVKRANQGLPRQMYFFVDQLERTSLWRSLGMSVFNETLTACTLDDPRYVQILELIYKWTYVDRLLPTAADTASMATEAGYGGQRLQLFKSGNYAMVYTGRHGIILFREAGNLDLDVSELPNGGFPNIVISTRAANIYTGSRHPELAAYFLKFLASEEYNQLIVEDGDGLPPRPDQARTEAFTHPAKYPNEHDFHEPFYRFSEEIAIASSYSPYVLPSIVTRIERSAFDAFMFNRITASQAAQMAATNINMEIQRTLKDDPSLQAEYEQQVEIQKKIDVLKAKGEPIPVEWIRNPFYRQYYRATGQLLEQNSHGNS